MAQVDLHALRSAIHAAALHPSLWPETMARFGRAVGEVKTHLFSVDLATGRPLLAATSGFSDEALQAIDDHFGQINPWTPGWAASAVGVPVSGNQMCPREIVVATEFYADWVRPNEDILAGGGMVLERSAERATLLGGNIRERDRDAVEGRWLALLKILGPEVKRAVEVNARLSGLALEVHLLRQGTDLRRSAVIAVAGGRRVVWASPDSAALLTSGKLRLDLRGRLMPLPDPVAERRFARALVAAQSQAIASGPLPVAGLRLRVLPLDTTVVPFAPLGPIAPLYGTLALLVEEPPSRQPDPAPARLSQLGLTAAEVAVALALALGETSDEIAQARGTSVHTVRNQIKTCLSKAGIRRQAELVALVERSRRGA